MIQVVRFAYLQKRTTTLKCKKLDKSVLEFYLKTDSNIQYSEVELYNTLSLNNFQSTSNSFTNP